jgi:hypothetical protein
MTRLSVASLAKLLSAILNSDVMDGIHEIVNLALRFRHAPGLYEVLEHNVYLVLKDNQGKRASYAKHQRIRFLQDNVIALQDTAWGDGKFLVNYRCSPGVAVDRYREGHRYRILISLRENKRRGDIEELHVSRDIRGGFLSEHEYLQTEIYHRTHKLTISVTFPRTRPPSGTWITEAIANRTRVIDSNSVRKLPDGRVRLVWRVTRPTLHESYLLKWDW